MLLLAIVGLASHCCRGLLFPLVSHVPAPAPTPLARATIPKQGDRSTLPAPRPDSKPGTVWDNPSLLAAATATSTTTGGYSYLPPPGTEPPVQTQAQQMSDAMVLKTMRGTQWRVLEDRSASAFYSGTDSHSPRTCRSLATFAGFAGEFNKGTVSVEYSCGSSSSSSSSAMPTAQGRSSGRWVTKPSRLSRGSIQLSPRWKVRLPKESGGGTVIYKGFIDAQKMIGRGGKSVSAEMTGVILTGEEVNKEKVIGRFTADFVRQLDDEEVDALKIGGGGGKEITATGSSNNGPITLSPK
ncbi:unnamed protein product [Pseudo-nitzschia multistriata]|uniref:Uncharacterized protein n=1 Tax=Pseudo-nitzschia multistriata TaxID=183589 RepID=A0A448YWH2_9STRA|nr:unnamed protein product [Pseudo-nitzschia multistriata]